MIEQPPPADNDDTQPPALSHTTKLIIGVLAGAAVAAWVMPPS
jgi:hypothetical protein